MALKTSDSNISSFKIFLRNIIDLFLVSRPTLFEDSFHQLMRLPAYELRRRLYIIFKVIQTNIHFIILNAFCIITVYNVKCEKIVITTEFFGENNELNCDMSMTKVFAISWKIFFSKIFTMFYIFGFDKISIKIKFIFQKIWNR